MNSKKSMNSKKRYPANDAFKKGSPSTIESACRKPDICLAYVRKRENYRALKSEYQKAQVKLEQMDQLKKDNDTKLIQLTKMNDTIIKLNTTITELENSSRVGNNPTLIKNLQNRIDKIQKENDHLKEQLEKAKEEHLHFNTIWKTEGITEQDIIDMKRQISDQCDLIKGLKQENTTLKQEHGGLIHELESIDEIKKERDDYKGLSEEWKEQSNEICNLMGKDTDGWSNIAGDTLEDVKELLSERDELRSKVEKYRNNISQMFDSL